MELPPKFPENYRTRHMNDVHNDHRKEDKTQLDMLIEEVAEHKRKHAELEKLFKETMTDHTESIIEIRREVSELGAHGLILGHAYVQAPDPLARGCRFWHEINGTCMKSYNEHFCAKRRINEALYIAFECGQTDGAHHKAWVIDQMVRLLLGDNEKYEKLIKEWCDGDDGPDTFEWDCGVEP